MKPIVISKATARRFVLGRQGLWPGRRWKGKTGTAQALTACEAVQFDPLQATARSQDLVLHSRVQDYKPSHLQQVMYKERRFFDYGGWLAAYPMSELPYWRLHMDRRSLDQRVEDFTFTHAGVFEQVRSELRERGPLGNRQLEGKAVGWNYRGRKDTSLALFHLWLSGELMIHHRDGFSRIYDFRQNIAPPEFDYVAPEREAEQYFARKCIAFKGLMPEAAWKTDLAYYLHRSIGREEMQARRDQWLEDGIVAVVQIEGQAGNNLVLAQDLPILDALQAARIPRGWKPVDCTTLEEVTLLAPLDIVSARGRALKLFDFYYKWEVYTPLSQRRWGYYTLPILYGDQLVARLDAKLERGSMTLQIKGFWAEPQAPLRDEVFISAFAKGLLRFARFLEAEQINLSGIRPISLRTGLKRIIGDSMAVSCKPSAATAAVDEEPA